MLRFLQVRGRHTSMGAAALFFLAVVTSGCGVMETRAPQGGKADNIGEAFASDCYDASTGMFHPGLTDSHCGTGGENCWACPSGWSCQRYVGGGGICESDKVANQPTDPPAVQRSWLFDFVYLSFYAYPDPSESGMYNLDVSGTNQIGVELNIENCTTCDTEMERSANEGVLSGYPESITEVFEDDLFQPFKPLVATVYEIDASTWERKILSTCALQPDVTLDGYVVQLEATTCTAPPPYENQVATLIVSFLSTQ